MPEQDELVTRVTLLGSRDFMAKMNSMTSTLKSYMGIASSLGGVSFVGQGFQRLQQYQMSLVKLTVAVGSYAESIRLMQQAQDLANRTPLELQEVVDMMLVLQPTARATGRNLMDMVRMAGDAAVMFGQFGEDAVQFARDIALAAAGSGAGMEGLRYRTNFVINLMQEDFRIGGRHAGRTFIEALEIELRRFSGAMEIMSAFMRGAVTTVDDAIGLIQRRFVEIPFIQDNITRGMLAISNAISDASESTQQFFGALMFARPLLYRLKPALGAALDALLTGMMVGARGKGSREFINRTLKGLAEALGTVMPGLLENMRETGNPIQEMSDLIAKGWEKARQQMEAARAAMENMRRTLMAGDFRQYWAMAEPDMRRALSSIFEMRQQMAQFLPIQRQLLEGQRNIANLTRLEQLLKEQTRLATKRAMESVIMFMRSGDPTMLRQAVQADKEIWKIMEEQVKTQEQIVQQRHRLSQAIVENIEIERRWRDMSREFAERRTQLEERRINLRERAARAVFGGMGELLMARQVYNERLRLIDLDTMRQQQRLQQLYEEREQIKFLYLTREEREQRLQAIQQQINDARIRVEENVIRRQEEQVSLIEKMFQVMGQDRALVGMGIALARGAISPATIQQMGGRVMAGGMPGLDFLRAMGVGFSPGFAGLPRMTVDMTGPLRVVIEDGAGNQLATGRGIMQGLTGMLTGMGGYRAGG
jgi:hypothetical protein